MIGMLYGRRLDRLSLADVALHLLEEMGEVSDSLVRMHTYLATDSIERELVARQLRLEDELADVLSWLFALVEHLSSNQTQLAQGKTLRLSKILWGKYGSDEIGSFWCRHCRSITCKCPVILIQREEEVVRIVSDLSNRHQ
jgi:NTP pyrophosphatase (non-canonical NTP hydrolase)